MIDPTPEQIEAAARAGAEAQRGVTAHVNERDRRFARAALVAAAGAAPQRPSVDRVHAVLDQNSVEFHHPEYGIGLFTTCADEIAASLAFPVQVDEAKLAEVLSANVNPDDVTGTTIKLDVALDAVVEWLRGGGQ